MDVKMCLVITYSLKLKFICSHVNALFPSADRQTLADFSKIASYSFHQAGQGAMCDPNAYPRSRFLSLSALDGVYSKMFRLPRTSACIYCTSICRVLLKWVEICYKKMKENRGDCFYNMFIAIYD